IFKTFQRQSRQYAELLGGDIDVMTQVPAADVAAAREDLGDRYQRRPPADLNFLAFPAYEKDLANPDVRQAISMAIDRDRIAESVFHGAQLPARSFVAPVAAGYRPDSCGPACEFDPGTARKLYAQAGGPARLRITYNADGGHKAWVDATCAQLAENLGVPCDGVAEPTFADLAARLDSEQPVGMFRMRSLMSFPSMADYLGTLYATAGSSNYFGYSNPRFDQLVREGDAARKPADAIAKYQQAEDVLAQDMPVIPLRFGQADFAYSRRVAHVRADVFGRVDLAALTLVD
ncbi:MAG: ABC transporter substrate-binding protein, partial [Micromonosporaceae bacterium]|nr:ABC transporter substrate-binding protein [Micromonosporaceae bacterium]